MVVEFHHKHKNARRYFWKCICDCGNKRIINSGNLKNGTTKSCGCLHREISKRIALKINLKHGLSHTRFWIIWRGMKQRCLNKKYNEYRYYGGRGITICKRWHKFENFRDDIYKSYLQHVKEFGEKNTTIDRKNVNGNYTPKNTLWSTYKQQANNKRNNHFITYNGKTQNIMQWSEEIGIIYGTLKSRLRSGWSIKKALTHNI